MAKLLSLAVDDVPRSLERKTLHAQDNEAPQGQIEFHRAAVEHRHAEVGGVQVKAGDRVRIRPKKRADVMDMALAGKIALIEAVEQDSKAGCNSFSCSTMTLVAISACCGCQARKMTCSF